MKYNMSKLSRVHWFETIFAKKKILAQNWRNKNLSESVSGYYKTKKEKEKKKWHGPLSHWCRGVKTLVVRPLKKHFFYVCLP